MLINSTAITAMNVRKKDIWFQDRCWTTDLMDEKLSSLIGEGYEVVIAPTSGVLDLTTHTNINHKYVFVWRYDSLDTKNISLEKTMTDSSGRIDTLGGDVVILNVVVDLVNRIVGTIGRNMFTISAYSTDGYYNKLSFLFGHMEIRSSDASLWLNEINIQNSIVDFWSGKYSSFVVKDSDIMIYATISIRQTISSNIFENSYFRINSGLTIDFYLYGQFSIKNCVFLGNNTNCEIRFLDTIPDQTLNFANVLLSNIGLFIEENSISTDNNSIIFLTNVYFSALMTTSNYIFKSISREPSDFLSRYDSIDTDKIYNDTNYGTIDLIVTQERRSFRGTLGTIKRQYYNVQFSQNLQIDPAFKYFDDNDLLIIKRTQEETELTPTNTAINAKRIRGLHFFESDGITEYTYRNDENFLCLGEKSGGDRCIFAFYKGEIRPTIFSDIYSNETYWIVACFQIWRPPTDVSVRNLLIMPDGPLTGNLLYEDLTSTVVIL